MGQTEGGTPEGVNTPTPESLSPVGEARSSIGEGAKQPDADCTTDHSEDEPCTTTYMGVNGLTTKTSSRNQTFSSLAKARAAKRPPKTAGGAKMGGRSFAAGLLGYFQQPTAEEGAKVKTEDENEVGFEDALDANNERLSDRHPSTDHANNISGQENGTSSLHSSHAPNNVDEDMTIDSPSSAPKEFTTSSGRPTRQARKSYVEDDIDGSPSSDDDSEEEYQPGRHASVSDDEDSEMLDDASVESEVEARATKSTPQSKRQPRTSTSSGRKGRKPAQVPETMPVNIRNMYGYNRWHMAHAERRYRRDLNKLNRANNAAALRVAVTWRRESYEGGLFFDDLPEGEIDRREVKLFDAIYGKEPRMLPQDRLAMRVTRSWKFAENDDDGMDFDMKFDDDTEDWFEESLACGEFACKFVTPESSPVSQRSVRGTSPVHQAPIKREPVPQSPLGRRLFHQPPGTQAAVRQSPIHQSPALRQSAVHRSPTGQPPLRRLLPAPIDLTVDDQVPVRRPTFRQPPTPQTPRLSRRMVIDLTEDC